MKYVGFASIVFEQIFVAVNVKIGSLKPHILCYSHLLYLITVSLIVMKGAEWLHITINFETSMISIR